MTLNSTSMAANAEPSSSTSLLQKLHNLSKQMGTGAKDAIGAQLSFANLLSSAENEPLPEPPQAEPMAAQATSAVDETSGEVAKKNAQKQDDTDEPIGVVPTVLQGLMQWQNLDSIQNIAKRRALSSAQPSAPVPAERAFTPLQPEGAKPDAQALNPAAGNGTIPIDPALMTTDKAIPQPMQAFIQAHVATMSDSAAKTTSTEQALAPSTPTDEKAPDLTSGSPAPAPVNKAPDAEATTLSRFAHKPLVSAALVAHPNPSATQALQTAASMAAQSPALASDAQRSTAASSLNLAQPGEQLAKALGESNMGVDGLSHTQVVQASGGLSGAFDALSASSTAAAMPANAERTLDAPAASFGEQLTQSLQELQPEVAYWSAQGLQHASMTITSGDQAPLGIKVSMKDGELHIDFQTDDATMKAELVQNAHQLLQGMFEKQGLNLANVTIADQPLPANLAGMFMQQSGADANGGSSGQSTQAQGQGGSKPIGRKLPPAVTAADVAAQDGNQRVGNNTHQVDLFA